MIATDVEACKRAVQIVDKNALWVLSLGGRHSKPAMERQLLEDDLVHLRSLNRVNYLNSLSTGLDIVYSHGTGAIHDSH